MKKLFIFIRSIFEEAQKVEWLSRKDLIKYSVMVISFILIATTLVGFLDYGLISLRTFVTDIIL